MSAEGKPFVLADLGEIKINLRLGLNELALLEELFDIAIDDLGHRRTVTSGRTARAILYVCANREQLLKGGDPVHSLARIGEAADQAGWHVAAGAVARAIGNAFRTEDAPAGEDGPKSPGIGGQPESKQSDA